MHAMCSRHYRKSTWGTEGVTQQYWPAFCVTLGPRERTKAPMSEGACTRTSTPLTVIKRHTGHCSTNDSPNLGPPPVEDSDKTINRTAARSQLEPRFPPTDVSKTLWVFHTVIWHVLSGVTYLFVFFSRKFLSDLDQLVLFEMRAEGLLCTGVPVTLYNYSCCYMMLLRMCHMYIASIYPFQLQLAYTTAWLRTS